jgi:glucose/arabinose dehydrogenase/mono/diheme cytochrome c family protein
MPYGPKKPESPAALLTLALLLQMAGVTASWGQTVSASPSGAACPGANGGITLPKGFCATIFADGIGHARQLAVASNGTVYVNTWSGVYYKNEKPPPGGFLVALKDTTGSGQSDVMHRFGDTFAESGHGGTGIALYKDALYAEINDRIVRYPLKDGDIDSKEESETVVSGLPVTGDHPMHPFTIDASGQLFVDLGSATNSCEVKNRMPYSPGRDPCPELETRGGTWRYDANKLGQQFSPKERFATGLRNGEGFDFDAQGRLFVTQHGRDQLHEDWPSLYTAKQGSELPAEEVVILKEGADYGWPECYYDGQQQKLVLAPEYDGDGGKKVGVCAGKQPPVAAFPAHWAPNDLKIYKGTQFPKAYQGGAFIAFHGSWNRAPGPQGGYNIVFQPFADGKPSGDYIVFADGFAGAYKDPGRAAHRPSGLAVGPDGALYVSDDVKGRIWRIIFTGDPDTAGLEAAPAPESREAASSPAVVPPEGIHPDAGNAAGGLPTPPGSNPAQVALGERIFDGDVGGATCAGCHGAGGIGTPVGPGLTSGKWLWGDGSLESIKQMIAKGVPEPKEHPGAMPPMGGVSLTKMDLEAVAAYVWALGHQRQQ